MQKKTDLKEFRSSTVLGVFYGIVNKSIKEINYAMTIYDTEVSTPCNIWSCTPYLIEMQDNSELKNLKGKELPNLFHGTE